MRSLTIGHSVIIIPLARHEVPIERTLDAVVVHQREDGLVATSVLLGNVPSSDGLILLDVSVHCFRRESSCHNEVWLRRSVFPSIISV